VLTVQYATVYVKDGPAGAVSQGRAQVCELLAATGFRELGTRSGSAKPQRGAASGREAPA